MPHVQNELPSCPPPSLRISTEHLLYPRHCVGTGIEPWTQQIKLPVLIKVAFSIRCGKPNKIIQSVFDGWSTLWTESVGVGIGSIRGGAVCDSLEWWGKPHHRRQESKQSLPRSGGGRRCSWKQKQSRNHVVCMCFWRLGWLISGLQFQLPVSSFTVTANGSSLTWCSKTFLTLTNFVLGIHLVSSPPWTP